MAQRAAAAAELGGRPPAISGPGAPPGPAAASGSAAGCPPAGTATDAPPAPPPPQPRPQGGGGIAETAQQSEAPGGAEPAVLPQPDVIFFQRLGLCPERAAALIRGAQRCEVDPGAVVCRRGEPRKDVVMVRRGEVVITRADGTQHTASRGCGLCPTEAITDFPWQVEVTADDADGATVWRWPLQRVNADLSLMVAVQALLLRSVGTAAAGGAPQPQPQPLGGFPTAEVRQPSPVRPSPDLIRREGVAAAIAAALTAAAAVCGGEERLGARHGKLLPFAVPPVGVDLGCLLRRDPEGRGVLVKSCQVGRAAYLQGLRAGDRVLGIALVKATSPAQAAELFRIHRGQEITLVVDTYDPGAMAAAAVVLAAAAAAAQLPRPIAAPGAAIALRPFVLRAGEARTSGLVHRAGAGTKLWVHRLVDRRARVTLVGTAGPYAAGWASVCDSKGGTLLVAYRGGKTITLVRRDTTQKWKMHFSNLVVSHIACGEDKGPATPYRSTLLGNRVVAVNGEVVASDADIFRAVRAAGTVMQMTVSFREPHWEDTQAAEAAEEEDRPAPLQWPLSLAGASYPDAPALFARVAELKQVLSCGDTLFLYALLRADPRREIAPGESVVKFSPTAAQGFYMLELAGNLTAEWDALGAVEELCAAAAAAPREASASPSLASPRSARAPSSSGEEGSLAPSWHSDDDWIEERERPPRPLTELRITRKKQVGRRGRKRKRAAPPASPAPAVPAGLAVLSLSGDNCRGLTPIHLARAFAGRKDSSGLPQPLATSDRAALFSSLAAAVELCGERWITMGSARCKVRGEAVPLDRSGAHPHHRELLEAWTRAQQGPVAPLSWSRRPPGLTVDPEFLNPEQEARLLHFVESLEWDEIHRGGRQVKQFGWSFGGAHGRERLSGPLEPIPELLQQLCVQRFMAPEFRNRVHTPPNQLIINRYAPGVGIEPHVDRPNLFDDTITVVSLGGHATLHFSKVQGGDPQNVLVPARSVYTMSGEARYDWRHGIDSVAEDHHPAIGCVMLRQTRVSLTFRRTLPEALPSERREPRAAPGPASYARPGPPGDRQRRAPRSPDRRRSRSPFSPPVAAGARRRHSPPVAPPPKRPRFDFTRGATRGRGAGGARIEYQRVDHSPGSRGRGGCGKGGRGRAGGEYERGGRSLGRGAGNRGSDLPRHASPPAQRAGAPSFRKRGRDGDARRPATTPNSWSKRQPPRGGRVIARSASPGDLQSSSPSPRRPAPRAPSPRAGPPRPAAARPPSAAQASPATPPAAAPADSPAAAPADAPAAAASPAATAPAAAAAEGDPQEDDEEDFLPEDDFY
eukprot:TRINITY_DN23203_c0_g1_i3.p1 TRINITY_DN23203_c0_g1~~TRINITY_DN23203_c0_g1_i3.p1  ORF type:complete len:1315 (+),score=246.77 TRINITY_DN23203_c0_g1_i3:714-4658(+)